MSRVTVVDVRTAFEGYAQTLKDMGVDVSALELQEGGSGITYRVTMDGFPAPGTSRAAFQEGFIGNTAQEAHHTLRTIIRSLEFAHSHLTH